jgi:hypothetical protein
VRASSHVAGRELGGRRPASSPAEIIDRVGELAEMGFRNLSLSFGWQTESDFRKQLDWLAASVLPAFSR